MTGVTCDCPGRQKEGPESGAGQEISADSVCRAKAQRTIVNP